MTPGRDAEFPRAVRAALLMHTCPVSLWDIIERRDTESMLPAVIAPRLLAVLLGPVGRWLALGALVVAVWCHGWLRGAQGVRDAWEAAQAKEQAAHLADVVRLAKAASEIELVWQNTTTTVRERAKVITREVPVYVSRESDARCTVPVGLERLWALDLQTDTTAPATGSGNDTASGLALSDVARGIVEAKERFALNRATAEACQAWARKITAHGTAHYPRSSLLP